MKRNEFLSVSLALPATFFPGTKRKFVTQNRPKKGFDVKGGQDRFGKSISLLEGDTFYTKVSSKDTDGQMYTFESTRLKNGGPALHVHENQDEWWYILEGEFKIKVGEEIYLAKTGDSVFGPRGIAHTFSKTNDGIARMIITFQPAGQMEEFFAAISSGAMKGKSDQEQDEFRKKHGFSRVGPALEQFKKF